MKLFTTLAATFALLALPALAADDHCSSMMWVDHAVSDVEQDINSFCSSASEDAMCSVVGRISGTGHVGRADVLCQCATTGPGSCRRMGTWCTMGG